MTDAASALLARLSQREDGFTERKQSAHRTDITETLVAFANSVPAGRQAVLHIGVREDGLTVGVDNPDKAQKDVTEWAKQCFPEIAIQCEALTVEGGATVVAVVVPASDLRPHFTGPAYKRVGSRNERASAEMLDEMIAARNDKAGAILRHKHQHPTTPVAVNVPYVVPGMALGHTDRDCRIESCSAHSVQLHEIGRGMNQSVPLEHVLLTEDPTNLRPLKLTIDEPAGGSNRLQGAKPGAMVLEEGGPQGWSTAGRATRTPWS